MEAEQAAQLVILGLQTVPALLAAADSIKAGLQPGQTLTALNAAIATARQAALADAAKALIDLEAAAQK